jgi:hypothetical protein
VDSAITTLPAVSIASIRNNDLGRFDRFATPSGNVRFLRIAAVPKAPGLRSAAVVVLLTLHGPKRLGTP